MFVSEATKIWNNLRGIICLYKPGDVSLKYIRRMIINKICLDLNEMDCKPPTQYVSIEGNPTQQLSIEINTNLSDDPAVVGPRYQFEDLPCSWSNYLGTNTSGVLILGLRNGTSIAKYIRENKSTRAYRIKGIFGFASDNYHKSGKIIEKSTYKHIKQLHIDKLLSYMQAIHQKKMFELSGVDIQSQTAYDLATRGLIRPTNSKIPLIYGIKCIDFKLPEFTIEVQCVNEYETYLSSLIHEISTKLNSSAYCAGIQCIRHSHFTLDHALLHRQWNLQNIITNMEQCANIISKYDDIVSRKSVTLH